VGLLIIVNYRKEFTIAVGLLIANWQTIYNRYYGVTPKRSMILYIQYIHSFDENSHSCMSVCISYIQTYIQSRNSTGRLSAFMYIYVCSTRVSLVADQLVFMFNISGSSQLLLKPKFNNARHASRLSSVYVAV
jgi:hypothetical protein